MDWGLLVGSLDNTGRLGRKLILQRPLMYYLAIIIDLVLRFTFVLTLVPSDFNPYAGLDFNHTFFDNYFTPLIAGAEVTRRMMWGVFRVEYEHVQTLSKYASDEFVPIFFPSTRKKDSDRDDESNTCCGRNKELIYEIVGASIAITVVAGLATLLVVHDF